MVVVELEVVVLVEVVRGRLTDRTFAAESARGPPSELQPASPTATIATAVAAPRTALN